MQPRPFTHTPSCVPLPAGGAARLLLMLHEHPDIWWLVVLHLLQFNGFHAICTFRSIRKPSVTHAVLDAWLYHVLVCYRNLHNLLKRDARAALPCVRFLTCGTYTLQASGGLYLRGFIRHLSPLHLCIEALDAVHRILIKGINPTRYASAQAAYASCVYPLEEKHFRTLQTVHIVAEVQRMRFLCDTEQVLHVFGTHAHGYRLSDLLLCDIFARINLMYPLHVPFILHCCLRTEITGYTIGSAGSLGPRLERICQCCACSRRSPARHCSICKGINDSHA